MGAVMFDPRFNTNRCRAISPEGGHPVLTSLIVTDFCRGMVNGHVAGGPWNKIILQEYAAQADCLRGAPSSASERDRDRP
jgi:hypothetical protein